MNNGTSGRGRDSLSAVKDNIKYFRRALDMTQKEFLEYFTADGNGELAMSAATFSNLESKGGSRLNEIVQAVCSRFSLDPEVFSLDVQSFTAAMNNCASTNGELQELLKNGDKEGNVGQLVNRLTMYFADEIISGRLHRGDQIATDRELAKQLGVGRSAIREALKVLDILGMIDIRLGQGTYLVGQESNFFAVPLSWSLFLDGGQIMNILEVRNVLELKSAELAASCDDEAKLAKLTDVYHEMYGSHAEHNLNAAIDEDIEFHSCIADCSGNPVIYSMLQTIRNLMRRVSESGLGDDVQLHEIFIEHRKIYGAIVSRNPELAVEAMKEHLADSFKRYKFDTVETALNNVDKG